jgi:protein required for attachment to host cells
MKNDLGLKLVIVADIKKLVFYIAQGIKIIEKLSEIAVPVDKHHRASKSDSHMQKGGAGNSLYEPHTPPETIEHKEAAHFICHELDNAMAGNSELKEIIIVADPKSLGFIRQEMKPNLKKMVTHEIAKDLTNHSKSDVEAIIFK